MQSISTDKLRAFLSALEQKQIIIQGEENEDPSLVYANAILRYQQVIDENPALPPQIVVIGPTQAGKSTVVNILLGTEAAVANALAGFTRHPQAFATDALDDDQAAVIDQLLPEHERVPLEALSDDSLKHYAITTVVGGDAIADPAVFWDTPDFDSVSSRSYRFGVPRLCAMADLIVLVVSREKYADQSVWETLRLINQLPHPLAICINKSSPDSAQQITAALEKKLADEGIDHGGITTLPYEITPDLGEMIAGETGQSLRNLARELLPEQREGIDADRLRAFLQSRWLTWTAPLRREIAAGKRWSEMVENGITQAETGYQQNYLRDPHYSDTLQRAIVKLMDLLEMPGVGEHIGRVRNAISWPARTLIGRFFGQNEKTDDSGRKRDFEAITLAELTNELLIGLQRASGEEAATGDADLRDWWQQLWLRLQQESGPLKSFIQQQIEAHQEAFEPRIQAAAEDLFHYLEQHPATLNSLRAARVTTDVGALVLALKTGGIGLNDLVLAPAMLAFTSMLTEGAVGRYMTGVEEELKAAQLESVREHILEPLRQRLKQLPTTLDPTTIYGFDEAALYAAEEELNSL